MNYHEEEEDKGEDRIRKLEAVMKQFDRANTVFHEAITADTVEKRKELLEQAVREYTEILPLLPRMNSWDIRLIRRTVLDKIHAVESWIEKEIERSVASSLSVCRAREVVAEEEEEEEALAGARGRLSLQADVV